MTVLNILLDAAPAPSPMGGSGGLIMILAIFVIFYFFMIRPQMKKQKELKNYRDALQKGDKVVTTGGIYGKLSGISEQTVEMEIASGITIKVDKYAILKDSTDLANQK